jgi:hypothetical protein
MAAPRLDASGHFATRRMLAKIAANSTPDRMKTGGKAPPVCMLPWFFYRLRRSFTIKNY